MASNSCNLGFGAGSPGITLGPTFFRSVRTVDRQRKALTEKIVANAAEAVQAGRPFAVRKGHRE
jgi:hypothetical protein